MVTRPGQSTLSSRSGEETQSWSSRLAREPITPEEQARFTTDVERLNLSEGIWDVFNATLQTRTKHSIPLTLRAFDNGSLIGLALIYECRKTGECFFDPPFSTMMDLPAIPMFVWLRYGTTVDHFANPGFVTDGIDRELFVGHSISRLLKHYLFGTVVEYRDSTAFDGVAKLPFVDNGVINLLGMASIDSYLARGKNLSRKLKKFRNKGGEIRIIRGALPPDLITAALEAFETLSFGMRTPFQDNYLNMAQAGLTHESSDKVHIVALLHGEYAGHQSFLHAGDSLHCQAGAFDRRRKSTYHAYENIIVSSVEYALQNNLQRIDYGPVTNETKAKMMTGFIPCENRTYARYRSVAATLPLVVKRSKLAPELMAPWCNLGEQPPLKFV
jgi:hypothetical protein